MIIFSKNLEFEKWQFGHPLDQFMRALKILFNAGTEGNYLWVTNYHAQQNGSIFHWGQFSAIKIIVFIKKKIKQINISFLSSIVKR